MTFRYIGFIAAAAATVSIAGDLSIPDTPAQKVAAHTYVIHGPRSFPNPENKGFMNNPAFVVTNDGVVVVDPGSSVHVGRMLLKQIAKATDKPVTHVYGTHIHGDHWLGNHAIVETFPKAELIAHPDMVKRAPGGDGKSWIELMMTLTKGATAGTEIKAPTVTAKDGDSRKIGGLTFRIHAPEKAHSHTDIMIEVPEDKLLFTGDNATANRVPRMDDGTYKGSIAAMERALKLDVGVVVPGHGPTGGKKVLTDFRDLLNTVYGEAKKHRADGKEDFEMKPAVAAKLDRWKQWEGFDEAVGKWLSLAVLEIDAE